MPLHPWSFAAIIPKAEGDSLATGRAQAIGAGKKSPPARAKPQFIFLFASGTWAGPKKEKEWSAENEC